MGTKRAMLSTYDAWEHGLLQHLACFAADQGTMLTWLLCSMPCPLLLACCAQRVSQRDGAAVDVDARLVQAQLLDAVRCLWASQHVHETDVMTEPKAKSNSHCRRSHSMWEPVKRLNSWDFGPGSA